jgi:hypothetical protein
VRFIHDQTCINGLPTPSAKQISSFIENLVRQIDEKEKRIPDVKSDVVFSRFRLDSFFAVEGITRSRVSLYL